MPIELKVPSAGESITEVTIVEWLKAEGAFAKPDETVAVIETDKANVEVVAPTAGRISRILKNAGAVATVGEVIGYLEPGPAGAEAPVAAAAPVAPPKAVAAPAPVAAPSPPAAVAPKAEAPILRAPPSMRRELREKGIDPSTVANGRLTHADGLRAEIVPEGGQRNEERVPMTKLRQRIAERLVHSQTTAALLTTFNEVDMGAVMALRAQYQDEFVKRHGVKLGFMSFFVKAAVEALKEQPAINAEIQGTDIVYKNYYDIGVAVGGGRGLVVPVLRNAERKSFAQIEKDIADFGARAKDNKLKPEELQGGTFTISNGGIYGSLMSTPIINPPQSGILGMHAIQDRPVVRNGQVVVAKMMYLALTYDHRLVDGREAVTFLVQIKNLVENPTRILLEV
ncbi:MAG: dihydrolipoyllysine-residue succinyltransferase [Deltaproteobacteria bacterium]|jgi:2-oxoglutarate dehydrogenase E2 component (dihydrolipoamide succinyltransferase)|nr:dihydrolipoyllysine-residue succinyltransferase [Deltaproteobacteria bacterium]